MLKINKELPEKNLGFCCFRTYVRLRDNDFCRRFYRRKHQRKNCWRHCANNLFVYFRKLDRSSSEK